MKHLKVVDLDARAVGEIIEVPDSLDEDFLDIACNPGCNVVVGCDCC